MKKENLYRFINYFSNKAGLEIRRFPSRAQRRLISYLDKNNIQYCLDAGANIGQFSKNLRAAGYRGRILSFEPQKNAFNQLMHNKGKDSLWEAINIGLGDRNENMQINISENSVSSSILPILDTHTEASAESKYIRKEEIIVKRLDTVVEEKKINEDFFLKIDAQGFESKIIDGAWGCMPQIKALQMELACVPLYDGEMLFDDMKKRIEAEGFFISSIEGGFADEKNGRLLQVEVVFLRK